MNENIIPVNNEALSRALVAVVGEETAAVIVKSYQEIDKAMAAGFEQGVKAAHEAQKSKDSEAEAQAKFLFQDAYDRGYERGSDDHQYAYDDGYVDGVSDARVCPADADARVAELCADEGYPEGSEDDFDDYEPEGYAEQEAELAKRKNALGMAQLAY